MGLLLQPQALLEGYPEGVEHPQLLLLEPRQLPGPGRDALQLRCGGQPGPESGQPRPYRGLTSDSVPLPCGVRTPLGSCHGEDGAVPGVRVRATRFQLGSDSVGAKADSAASASTRASAAAASSSLSESIAGTPGAPVRVRRRPGHGRQGLGRVRRGGWRRPWHPVMKPGVVTVGDVADAVRGAGKVLVTVVSGWPLTRTSPPSA